MSRAQRFSSTPGGAIAAGRRRLKSILGGAAVAMLLLAAGLWAAARIVPGLLALLAAFLAWTAWRMSGDLDPFWIDVGADEVVVQTRRHRKRIPLTGTAGRRLSRSEVAHLARLASANGITVGVGGFESSRLGELDLYASDLANAVILEREERAVVLTPDEPERFLASLARASRRDA